MTGMAAAGLAVAAVAAVANWIAVATGNRRAEYVAKPLTMVALVVVALALEPASASRRGWFVAAALFSLGGDIFLMLPRDRFAQGLVSFLVAHLCYIVGLVQLPPHAGSGLLGVAAVGVAVLLIGPRVLRAVRVHHAALFVPVVVYLVVIATMVVAAFASGPPLAVAGGMLFFTSDSILAVNRFVHPSRWGRTAVMVTYHVGQAGLIGSLATSA